MQRVCVIQFPSCAFFVHVEVGTVLRLRAGKVKIQSITHISHSKSQFSHVASLRGDIVRESFSFPAFIGIFRLQTTR